MNHRHSVTIDNSNFDAILNELEEGISLNEWDKINNVLELLYIAREEIFITDEDFDIDWG